MHEAGLSKQIVQGLKYKRPLDFTSDVKGLVAATHNQFFQALWACVRSIKDTEPAEGGPYAAWEHFGI